MLQVELLDIMVLRSTSEQLIVVRPDGVTAAQWGERWSALPDGASRGTNGASRGSRRMKCALLPCGAFKAQKC